MDTDPGDVSVPDLDFAGVQTSTNLDAQRSERVSDSEGTTNRPTWSVERGQHAVASHFDHPTSVLFNDRTSNGIMGFQETAPLSVTHCGRTLGRIYDVGKKNCREGTIGFDDSSEPTQESVKLTQRVS